MKCPACQYNGSKVVDSRPADANKSIRRRRECESCGFRFTTFEKIEDTPLIVVKKDGSRDEFVGRKILRGLIRACEKRPISLENLENIVYIIEKELRSSGVVEIDSKDLGEMVMEKLADVDEVAYVRFASVYREYQDVSVFIEELKNLQTRTARD
ncbi:transcriptional regulator NrdR [Sporosarcina pasteurii]|uniref:Transcriptional repressor NrdR n=1 Tax=Sporosarcina pasteurii TaxID=1474 RepID=A0A380C6N1_SPOPA|nr:transcriptional regulator NrdR [Sporosarcina pasteurii]MDS9471722.1 transcriptional regulator NrdR [Sporosarcina pasteurii]QBQ04679.1 transcriptional regulator NrdR [Sporosarcina pasteurii]SUJ12760.1 Transcriptional repressor NrdR [Sporosarcina pasteurii]